MITHIRLKTAANCLLAILSALLIFHVLILAGVIPFDIVWGSRLDDAQQMLVFESLSVVMIGFIMVVVSLKAGYVLSVSDRRWLRVIVWCLVAFFLLNTLGNLLSQNGFEKVVFTPVTLIMAALFYRLAVES